MGQEASTAAGTNEAGGKPRAPRKPQRVPQAAEGFGLDNVKLKDECVLAAWLVYQPRSDACVRFALVCLYPRVRV